MKTKRIIQLLRLAMAVIMIAALTVLKNTNQPIQEQQAASYSQAATF